MPHTGAPIVAIVIAVVVAAGLAGLVIFSYIKARNSDAIKRTDSNSQTVVEKPQASVSDVDTTTEEVDKALEQADDSTDFSETQLSDTTLGL